MEIVIAAAVLALGFVAAATLYRGRLATANGGHADAPAAADLRHRGAAAAHARAAQRGPAPEGAPGRPAGQPGARGGGPRAPRGRPAGPGGQPPPPPHRPHAGARAG